MSFQISNTSTMTPHFSYEKESVQSDTGDGRNLPVGREKQDESSCCSCFGKKHNDSTTVTSVITTPPSVMSHNESNLQTIEDLLELELGTRFPQ